MFTFAKGDEVEWTSQSQGYATTKRGVVVWVVSAGADTPSVADLAEAEGLKEPLGVNRVKFDTEGSRYGKTVPRKEDSYIIRVRKSYYRPRTSLLRKATT